MIHGKMYGLYCPYGIHYLCGMILACNGTLHCICIGTSHFMGVSAWLNPKPHSVFDGWAWYHCTNSNRVTLLNEMVKTCVG